MTQEATVVAQEAMVITQEMQVAIVGVLGTLAGTILGWILNNLSNRGKLNIYVSSWTEKFNRFVYGVTSPSRSKEETRGYTYHVTLDLYNSSGTTRIMRDIEISFSDGNKELTRHTPQNDATATPGIVGGMNYSQVGAINILPRTVVQLELHYGELGENDGIENVWNTQKVYLHYVDEKNKKRKVLIQEVNYDDYFSKHQQEVTDNEQAEDAQPE